MQVEYSDIHLIIVLTDTVIQRSFHNVGFLPTPDVHALVTPDALENAQHWTVFLCASDYRGSPSVIDVLSLQLLYSGLLGCKDFFPDQRAASFYLIDSRRKIGEVPIFRAGQSPRFFRSMFPVVISCWYKCFMSLYVRCAHVACNQTARKQNTLSAELLYSSHGLVAVHSVLKPRRESLVSRFMTTGRSLISSSTESAGGLAGSRTIFRGSDVWRHRCEAVLEMLLKLSLVSFPVIVAETEPVEADT